LRDSMSDRTETGLASNKDRLVARFIQIEG
jgi:hypothetical protein